MTEYLGGLNDLVEAIDLVRVRPLNHVLLTEPISNDCEYDDIFWGDNISFIDNNIGAARIFENDTVVGTSTCSKNENCTENVVTYNISTDTMKTRRKVTVIKRDIIPRNSLQLYHTTTSKDELPNRKHVENELEEMKRFKRDVKGYARIEIKQIMVRTAAYINMTRPEDGGIVQTYNEIGNVWKEWNGISMIDIPPKMFYLMYGWFDENPNWSRVLEKKYMKTHALIYNSKRLEQKSPNHKVRSNAICMLIQIVKNDHVKMINQKSLNTHQKKITITVKDGMGSTSVWKKRRKKGKFKSSFVTYHTNTKQDRAIQKERDDCIIKQDTEKDTNKTEENDKEPINILHDIPVNCINIEEIKKSVINVEGGTKGENKIITDKDNSKEITVTDMTTVDCTQKKKGIQQNIDNNYNSKSMKRLKKKYQERLTEMQHEFDSKNINEIVNKKITKKQENHTTVEAPNTTLKKKNQLKKGKKGNITNVSQNNLIYDTTNNNMKTRKNNKSKNTVELQPDLMATTTKRNNDSQLQNKKKRTTKIVTKQKKISVIKKKTYNKSDKIITKISTTKKIQVKEKKKNEKRKKPTMTIEEEINEEDCPENHQDLSMSFNQEENAKYWKLGGSMYGVFCKGCNGSFYDSKSCRPTCKNIARTCKGREKHGCPYALCNTCFTEKLIEWDSKHGSNMRTKRTRR